MQLATPERDLLGEAPLYDAVGGRLLWVDMFGQKIHELVFRAPGAWSYGRTWVTSNLATAAIPRAGGGFLAAVGHELIAMSDDEPDSPFAALDRHDDLLADARCDAHGRLFALRTNHDRRSLGGLVRLESDRRFTPILSDVALPNGLDWSPDQATLYVGDSIACRIDALDYDVSSGEVGDRRPLIEIERGKGACNGFAVDHDGCLWVAVTFAGELRRYSPAGELLDTVKTPALRPTSCAFGGPDGADLFVTSSAFMPPDHVLERVGISRAHLDATKTEELAGGLFVFRPGCSGPAATPFAA